ncbi:CDK-activating kinase assembly factor MAT1 [Trichogramma pretiosum]|uniref:CDK-activating kinase assembly factor MAT1 n=1 Tax=Trichogramma pretiosum TaxID=7493 RepID=UPI0006C94353|nr:CDK-activating kinase assembly factor MAT1 [Trichogramma pretiosum]XP_014236477.1 CDK-activating kinase assembly factor MAT1 [Trichogramma pretiosum]
MEDQACPRCKTTKYRNPSLKLLVNVCGHTLCESCVDLLFLKGSGSCPDCHIPLRRVNFRVQLYEDAAVEKEVDIRKRILRDFNKKEEDFATQREYDDYLEEVEDIIFNLSNNIDVVETNKRIEQYKRENKELIQKNKHKWGKKENELEELLEQEKLEQEEKRQEMAKLELELQKKKVQQKEALIDELMFSEGDAKSIVQTFASNIQATKEELKVAPKATGFSSGIKFSQQSSSGFLPVPKIEEGPKYKYVPISQDFEGPTPPNWKDLKSKGFLSNVRPTNDMDKASGFEVSVPCLRALQEAMSCLYHNPKTHRKEQIAETI